MKKENCKEEEHENLLDEIAEESQTHMLNKVNNILEEMIKKTEKKVMKSNLDWALNKI